MNTSSIQRALDILLYEHEIPHFVTAGDEDVSCQIFPYIHIKNIDPRQRKVRDRYDSVL